MFKKRATLSLFLATRLYERKIFVLVSTLHCRSVSNTHASAHTLCLAIETNFCAVRARSRKIAKLKSTGTKQYETIGYSSGSRATSNEVGAVAGPDMLLLLTSMARLLPQPSGRWWVLDKM